MNLEQTKLWEQIIETSWNYQKSMDNLSRKQVGAYYTDLEFTDVMTNQLLKEWIINLKKIYSLKLSLNLV